MPDKTLLTQQKQMMLALLNMNQNFNHSLIDIENLDTQESLALYQFGYSARLCACLQTDFPALAQFLGNTLFTQFITEYLQKHPSTSASLYDLGVGFPKYLEKTLPDINSLSKSNQALAMLPIEIAKLERSRLDSLRAKGVEHIPLEQRPEPDYQDISSLLDLTLKTPESLKLMQSHFDLISYYKKLCNMNDNETIEFPRIEVNFIAISRYNYTLHMSSLEEWHYLFIKEVQSEDTIKPLTLGHIISNIASCLNIKEESLHSQLSFWLPTAKMKGLIE